jgi:hypothetical protein
MSTRRFGLLAALVVSLWALDGAPRTGFVGPEHGAHADTLSASRHVAAGVVARTLRTPLPSASVGLACGCLAALAFARAGFRRVPAPRRQTPLYALFRVYRL